MSPLKWFQQDLCPPGGWISALQKLSYCSSFVCSSLPNQSACREEAIIDIFERSTNSVANVFDITLQVKP